MCIPMHPAVCSLLPSTLRTESCRKIKIVEAMAFIKLLKIGGIVDLKECDAV